MHYTDRPTGWRWHWHTVISPSWVICTYVTQYNNWYSTLALVLKTVSMQKSLYFKLFEFSRTRKVTSSSPRVQRQIVADTDWIVSIRMGVIGNLLNCNLLTISTQYVRKYKLLSMLYLSAKEWWTPYRHSESFPTTHSTFSTVITNHQYHQWMGEAQ